MGSFAVTTIRRPMKTSSRFALAAACVLVAVVPTQAAQYDQRLANLSTRAQVGTGANIMITGFVVQAGAPKKVLIRAVGPRLTTFGVTGVLANPQIHLYNSNGTLVLSNDNWSADDAATMTSVGAFALIPGAQDAALVATLSPGAYTAQVSGVNNTAGVALLEIYDVTGSARLMNLSTRSLVGTGASTFFSGLSVAAGGGARRVLIRAAGPSLAALGVPGTIADPSLQVLDSAGRTVANGSNDNWESAGSSVVTTAATQSGAFPFPAGSRDAAVVMDLLPGNYVIQVNGVAGSTGTALVEVYDLSPDTISTIDVLASVATTDTKSLAPATFTFTRVGPVTSAITVDYTVTGTAVAGTDFTALSGKVTIPAGAVSAAVNLTPLANPANTNNRTATLSITPNATYGVGINDRATVTFFANTGSLYVSNLRAAPNATTSTAYGTATIQLAPDESHAFINVSFSSLSSPEVVAHLAIDGNYVFNLPQGQVNNAYWSFAPVGTYTTADLVAALKAGRVTVSIDTATYPAGELAGGFVRSSGSAAFNPPATPPAINLSQITPVDAARFLTQATFGATSPEIEALRVKGYNAWINEQMAMGPTLHRQATIDDFNMNATNGGVGNRDAVTLAYQRPGGPHRQAAWWKIAVTSPDQLRQRTAFALSQILVISDANGTVFQWQEGAANYYDIFVNNAFGNFRSILEEVTLNPLMGVYLSSLRNAKAANNTTPDENYAREIMQLFTIGLNELNPDGTLRLDPNGQPIPTYTQDTIVQTAKVFTGWSFSNLTPNATSNANLFRGTTPNIREYNEPMMLWPAFHDDTQKTIVGGRMIPAGQGGVKDLKDTLDALFNHPNTGPFISRQLIQRLVTSNPSPGYIYRVSQAFANNGAGVRGDIGAVVRAILLDYEARSPAVARSVTFGKLKEPVLRGTALLRAFNASSNHGRFNIPNAEGNLAQAALRAPTVFNFYEPDFVLPGATAAAGLYAPEYQITNALTAITQPNFYYTYVSFTRSTTNQLEQTPALNYDALIPLAAQPAQLVEAVNLLLASGSMSTAASQRITAAVTAMPSGTPAAERVRMAVYLTLTSPAGAIQK